MRAKHIKRITSARVKMVEPGKMIVKEVAEDGRVKATRERPFAYSMLPPAFRGIRAVSGIEGLSNPRGFMIVDKFQRNPKYRSDFAVGSASPSHRLAPRPCPAACPRGAS